MNNYKYLLFDADNTLFDFNKAEKAAFLSLGEGLPQIFSEETYDLYHRINDDMWKSLERGEITKSRLKTRRFELLFEALGYPCDESLAESTAKAYESALGNGRFMIDGAAPILEYLSAKYEIYIITNGLVNVQTKRFSGSELEKYIKKLFISEEIGFEKPDARFFETVLERVGDSDRDSYLVVGDSLSSDIKGAVNFGIDAVHFDPAGKGSGEYAVMTSVRHLSELRKFL